MVMKVLKLTAKKCLGEKFNFLLFPPGNSVFICVIRAKLMTSPASVPSCRSKLKWDKVMNYCHCFPKAFWGG